MEEEDFDFLEDGLIFRAQSISDLPQYEELYKTIQAILKSHKLGEKLSDDEVVSLTSALTKLTSILDGNEQELMMQNSQIDVNKIHGYQIISCAVNILLNNKMDEINSYKKNIDFEEDEENLTSILKHELNLPDFTNAENIVSVLQAKYYSVDEYNNEIEQLYNRIKELESKLLEANENKELWDDNEQFNFIEEKDEIFQKLPPEDQVQKLKQKIRKLLKNFEKTFEEKEEAQTEIYKLRTEINKMRIEKRLNLNSSDDFVVEQAFDGLEYQKLIEKQIRNNDELIAEMITEISEISNENAKLQYNQNSLVSLIHKSLSIIDELEIQLAKTSSERDDIAKQNKYIQEIPKDNNAKSVSTVLLKISQKVDEELGMQIKDSIDEVEKAVDIITKQLNNNNKTKTETRLSEDNEKLRIAASSELRFIEDIMESKPTLERLFMDEKPEDVRERIRKQTESIANFINLEAGGLSASLGLLDALRINSDPRTLAVEAALVMEKIDADNPLLIPFQQSLAAADLLKKFCRQAQIQIGVLGSNLEAAKVDASVDLESAKERFRNEKEKLEARISKTEEQVRKLQQTMSAVRYSLKENNQNPNVTVALSEIESALNIENIDDKNDSILNQPEIDIKLELEKERERRINIEKEHNIFKETVQQQLDALTKEVSEVSAAKEEVEAQSTLKLADLETTINNMMSKYEETLNTNKELQTELDNLRVTHSELEAKAQQETEELTRLIEINESRQEEGVERIALEKEELLKEIDLLKRDLEDAENRFESEIMEIDRAHKEAIEAAERRRSDEEASYLLVIEDLKQKLTDFRTNKKEILIQNSRLKEELNLQQRKTSNAELAQKVAETKLESAIKSSERQRTLIESQSRLREMSLKTKYDQEIEEAKLNYDKMLRSILVSIADSFPQFVEINSPIDENHASRIINKARSELEALAKQKHRFDAGEEEISQIQSILKSPQNASISESVLKLAEELNEIKKRKAVYVANEWEEWGLRINAMMSGSTMIGRSEGEIRRMIEERIFGGTRMEIKEGEDKDKDSDNEKDKDNKKEKEKEKGSFIDIGSNIDNENDRREEIIENLRKQKRLLIEFGSERIEPIRRIVNKSEVTIATLRVLLIVGVCGRRMIRLCGQCSSFRRVAPKMRLENKEKPLFFRYD